MVFSIIFGKMSLLLLALILTCVTAASRHRHGPSGFPLEEQDVFISDSDDDYLQPLHRNNAHFVFNNTGYCVFDPQYSSRLCKHDDFTPAYRYQYIIVVIAD